MSSPVEEHSTAFTIPVRRHRELRRLVPVLDHEAFARAWLNVLSDTEKAREPATAGLNYIALYDCDTVFGQFVELMEEYIELQRAK